MCVTFAELLLNGLKKNNSNEPPLREFFHIKIFLAKIIW